MNADFSDAETQFIRQARQGLEHPSLMIKMANLAGRPLHAGLNYLPARALTAIARATERALVRGLTVTLKTLPRAVPNADPAKADRRARIQGRRHTFMATGTGVAAGFFGGAAFPLEMVATTGIILRAIASIAAEFGFDPHDPVIQGECLYVLTLGAGPEPSPAGVVDSSYLRSRFAFSALLQNAGSYLAGKTAEEITLALQKKSAPALVRLFGEVAKRFEVVAAEKFLGQIVPIVSAVGGGALNALFTDYFTEMARFHFGLRALEQKFGADRVQRAYISAT